MGKREKSEFEYKKDQYAYEVPTAIDTESTSVNEDADCEQMTKGSTVDSVAILTDKRTGDNAIERPRIDRIVDSKNHRDHEDQQDSREFNSNSGVRRARIQMSPRKEYIPSSEGLEEFNLQIGSERNNKNEKNNEYLTNENSAARNANKRSRDRVLNASEDVFIKKDKRVVVLEILDWIKYLLIAVILGLLISKFVIQRSAVVGRSMEDTLHNEDQLLVDKLTLFFTHPERGDIVTVNGAKTYGGSEDAGMLVKRVVALPGDTIDFIDGKVIINGQAIQETYLNAGTYTMEPFDWSGEMTIPEGHYYVLGDNRSNSADSRIFGPVPENAVEGKVWIRIYPFDKFGKVD